MVSFASLSACSGLRGFIHVENLTYNINPIESSSTFQHLIYRTEEEESDSTACWLSSAEMSHSVTDLVREQILGKLDIYHLWKQTKYLEIFIQVDVQLFRMYSENVQITLRHVVRLTQMADDMFFTLGLRVLLVGVEIWTEQNLVLVTDYMKESMKQFNVWHIRNVLSQLKHDTAILLAHHNRGNAIVKHSHFGSICHANTAVAFISIRRTMPFQLFTIGIAHELGHVIGIPDDHLKTCYCAPKVKCIMDVKGPFGEKPLFSNCSTKSYFDVPQSRKAQYLNTIPKNIKIFAVSACGNGVVEDEEECDCGKHPMCQANKYCLDDCTMAPGAVCTTEPCCEGCQFAPKGTTCRRATNECHLPEYCNGTVAECLPNVLIQDGTPCSDDGYCFLGSCSSHTLQCQKIFGMNSKAGPLACFKWVNSIGDRFGNCRGEGGHELPNNFSKCTADHVLCGRVQCVNIQKLPNLEGSYKYNSDAGQQNGLLGIRIPLWIASH
ncbi:disintegrin and metalloproteinase domain-containing protein 9-like [Rhineura floridana]|uniref:disintegrin and metalloproteinase domain-containing protein 9-like n=1 Tax=Rhineura floridana TaxID=261503 RepID=UPI002AC8489B|nr:disintegrin and metalloproteinase domain-containing protein 9-like [Rhineura floridana]